MRLLSFAQTPASLASRILLQTTHQVTKKSGAVRMKSILSVTASVAMNWMIGSRLKRNSEEMQLLREPQRKQSRKHEVEQLENDSPKRQLTDHQSRLDASSTAADNGLLR